MKSQHFTHMKEFPSELKAKEDIFFQYKKLELYIEEDTLSFCRSKLNFDWCHCSCGGRLQGFQVSCCTFFESVHQILVDKMFLL